MASQVSAPKDALNRRIDEIGWGLFFLVTGAVLLVPDKVPGGTWLMAVGLILLGINGVRRVNDIPISVFTVVLGILALAAGIGDLLGVKLPLFAVLLIIIGVSVIVRQFMAYAR